MKVVSFDVTDLVVKFDLVLNLHASHQNLSLYVDYGRIHLFGLLFKEGNTYVSRLTY